MAQILREPGLAANLADALGSASSNALLQLADRKIYEAHKKQLHKEKTEALQGLGLRPEEASHLANLDPQLAQMYLSNRNFGVPEYNPQIDFGPELSQPNLPSFNQGLVDRFGTSPQQQLQQQLQSVFPRGGIPKQGLPEFQSGPREPQLEDFLNDPRLTPAQRANLALKISQAKQKATGSASNNAAGITPYQQRQLEERKRKTVRQENKKFNEDLDKELLNVTKVDKVLDEVESLLDKVGYFDTGLIGSSKPKTLRSNVAQRLDQEFNKLIVLESKIQGQGRGSDLLRRMVKEGKFSLEQSPEVMRENLRELRGVNQSVRDLGEARKRVLKQAGGEQPEDLSSLVLQEVEKNEFSDYDWQHPELWESGSVIEKDGKTYRQNNNKWVQVKKG